MQKLILFSIAIFTTITLMTACGENGNGSTTETTTEVSSQDVTNVSDSTLTTTEVVSDTTKK
jgi:hypothetical protein